MESKSDKCKKRILIVDDDKGSRGVVSFMLARRGYILEEAKNGKEALEKVTKNRPDIILLDIEMPIMNGFETCRKLKENLMTKDIPIILCTATHSDEIKEKKTKADDFIEKPFSVKKLCRKIDKILKEREK